MSGMDRTSLIKESYELVKTIKEENLLCLMFPGQPDRDRVEFKRRGSGGKSAPKKPKKKNYPTEIRAVELLIDLETALKQKDFQEVVKNFFPLARIVKFI